MEVDLDKLSHVVLGHSAEPPTPVVVRSLTTPVGRRRPVSMISIPNLRSTPSFPNLLSSLTERPQPLSPTIAKTPASRYIRPGRCVTDSTSSIDSLLGPPPPPLPARVPVPTPTLAPVSPPLPAATTEVECRELAGSLEAPVLENAVVATSAKPTEVLNPEEPLSQFTDSLSLKGFGSVLDAENSTTTPNTPTLVATTTTEVNTTISTSTAQLEDQEEEITATSLITTLRETALETGSNASTSKSSAILENGEEEIAESPSSTLGTILPITTTEADATVSARTTVAKTSTYLVTTLPESPPTTPPPIQAKTSTISISKTTELETTESPSEGDIFRNIRESPSEGDTFRDFRESPRSKLTPPATPSPPQTKAAGFGRFSSFSNLVQVVTSAKPSEMGLTGDNRAKTSLGQHGLFGGWLQAKGESARALVDGLSTKRDVGGQLPSVDRSQAVSNASKTVSGKENSVRSIATAEGCSMPIKQESSSVDSALMSHAKVTVSPLKSIPEPPHPALVDEFQGLNFSALINSFLNPRAQTKGPIKKQPDCPSTEVQLEELARMAQDLLERMYTAYTKRTLALGEVLADQSVLREEVEERKVKALHLQAQLDRVSQTAIKSKAEQDEVICDLVHELANEKIKMDEERGQWKGERERWRIRQQERIRAEEMLAAQGPNVNGTEITEEGADDADTMSTNKRTSTGAESSDSGFDESDSDSFYSIVKREPTVHRAVVVPIKPSLVSISSVPSTLARSDGNTDGSEKRFKVAQPIPNSTPTSVVQCKNCSRLPFTSTLPSPTPGTLDISSPSLPKGSESTQQPSTLLSATSTPTTSLRWGLGVLRGGNSNSGAQTQQELDRLRVENKSLRHRVGDLEKSVDEVLGVLGGWRS